MVDVNKARVPEPAAHAVSLTARAHAEITGVSEVKSFDEQGVMLDTACGRLVIEGEGLHVGTLDMARGVLMVDGKITAFYYVDTGSARKKSLFRG